MAFHTDPLSSVRIVPRVTIGRVTPFIPRERRNVKHSSASYLRLPRPTPAPALRAALAPQLYTIHPPRPFCASWRGDHIGRHDHIVNNGIIGIFEKSKKLKKTFTNTEQCLHDLYPDKGFGNPPSSSCQSSHTALLERRKTFIEAKDSEGLHLFFKSDYIIPTHTPRKKPHHQSSTNISTHRINTVVEDETFLGHWNKSRYRRNTFKLKMMS